MSTKSRAGALVLCFLLGLLGVHRFYVGKTGTALLMLVITFSGIGIWITAIWMVIDLIMIAIGSFKDGKGQQIINW